MKHLRAIKLARLAVLILVGVALLMGLEGCAPLLIDYDSDVGNRSAIRTKANITVTFEEQNLSPYFKKPETKKSIINVITSDLQQNLFYFGEDEIDVFVKVEKLSYRQRMWGLCLGPVFPIAGILGIPMATAFGEAQVSLEIHTLEGVFVGSYRSKKNASERFSMYTESKVSPIAKSSKGGISKDVLKLALEDIKNQIIANKGKINRAIQGIETVPETEELPPVVRSRPKVQARATNIAVMDLDAYAISVPEAQALTNRLRVELFNTGRYVVLERGKMHDILKEQGFQETGCTTTDCLVEVGQLLNMQHMVAGSVSKVGDVYSIEVRTINVGTGEIMAAAVEDITGSLGDLLTKGIRNAALKLVQ